MNNQTFGNNSFKTYWFGLIIVRKWMDDEWMKKKNCFCQDKEWPQIRGNQIDFIIVQKICV